MNLEVYPERDPEKITYSNLFTVQCPFRILGITKVQKSTMKVSWEGVHEKPSRPTAYMKTSTTI